MTAFPRVSIFALNVLWSSLTFNPIYINKICKTRVFRLICNFDKNKFMYNKYKIRSIIFLSRTQKRWLWDDYYLFQFPFLPLFIHWKTIIKYMSSDISSQIRSRMMQDTFNITIILCEWVSVSNNGFLTYTSS